MANQDFQARVDKMLAERAQPTSPPRKVAKPRFRLSAFFLVPLVLFGLWLVVRTLSNAPSDVAALTEVQQDQAVPMTPLQTVTDTETRVSLDLPAAWRPLSDEELRGFDEEFGSQDTGDYGVRFAYANSPELGFGAVTVLVYTTRDLSMAPMEFMEMMDALTGSFGWLSTLFGEVVEVVLPAEALTLAGRPAAQSVIYLREAGVDRYQRMRVIDTGYEQITVIAMWPAGATDLETIDGIVGSLTVN